MGFDFERRKKEFEMRDAARHMVTAAQENGQLEGLMKEHNVKISEVDRTIVTMRSNPTVATFKTISEKLGISRCRAQQRAERAIRTIANQIVRNKFLAEVLKNPKSLPDAPVSILSLDFRLSNALLVRQVYNMGELTKLSSCDLLAIKNLSSKGVEKLKEKMARFGLALSDERLEFGSVDSLKLTARTCNCLKVAGVRSIDELTQRSEDDLLCVKNFGKKSLEEIKEKLKEINLSLKPRR